VKKPEKDIEKFVFDFTLGDRFREERGFVSPGIEIKKNVMN
jgi:hypothetical protein